MDEKKDEKDDAKEEAAIDKAKDEVEEKEEKPAKKKDEVIETQELAQQKALAIEKDLKRGEKGFNVWLSKLDLHALEELVSQIKIGQNEKDELNTYIQWVRSSETIGLCSKCEWTTGCEKCSYGHALRYAIRWQKPSSWWNKLSGQSLKLNIKPKAKSA